MTTTTNNTTALKLKLHLLVVIFASCITTSQSVLHKNTHKNVYENIENCPVGFSGQDCSIRYELCLDGKRKCFNSSECKLMDKPDPISGYSYKCDCSFMEGVSPTAGYECEHSATVMCQGNHFCTNGGTCGNYVVARHRFNGCHCLDDFAGAHCQYLKEEMNGGLEGEAVVPEIGDNFYVKTDQIKPMYVLGGTAIIAMIFLSIGSIAYAIIAYRQNTVIKRLSAELKEADMTRNALQPDEEPKGEMA